MTEGKAKIEQEDCNKRSADICAEAKVYVQPKRRQICQPVTVLKPQTGAVEQNSIYRHEFIWILRSGRPVGQEIAPWVGVIFVAASGSDV